ncbi:TonB-dependent copper receptor [Chitinasiproducens palmae]
MLPASRVERSPLCAALRQAIPPSVRATGVRADRPADEGRRWRFSSLLPSIGLAFPCAAAAVQPSALPRGETELAPLETVVVTAVAPASPLTVITDPKVPRQPIPASDGADYLKTIPGFSAIRNGGSNGDPVLRGMFGSRLNILSNGSPMPGACPARMDAPTSYISPENFDRLIVIKGPQSVLWGPGASAGTIRFERDTPRFDKAGVRFDGAVLAGGYGRNDQSADLTFGDERFYARVTANHAHSQDYRDGDGNTVPSRWDKWNTDLTLGFTPDADTVFELTAGTGDGNARYAGRSMDGTRFRRESLSGRFEKRNLGETLRKIEAQLYYNDADHVMDNFTLRAPDPTSMMPNPMAADVNRTTVGGRLAATWQWGTRFDLTGGMDWQRSRHRSRSGTDVSPYQDAAWSKDATLGNLGWFAEGTWHADAMQRVVAGARLDLASAKDWRTNVGMMPMPNPSAGERRTAVLPSGFVRYERDLDALPATVYAGLGHVERFPDYWELFAPNMGPSGSSNAFDGLRPEKTTQLDIGAQYRTAALDAWVSAYAGYVQNFILFSYAPGGMMGDTSTARNVDAAIMGAELGVSYRLAPSWRVGSTLAYAAGNNRSDGGPLPQMPPLELRLSANYDSGAWSAGVLWRLVAAQHRVALNEGNVVGKDFGASSGFGTLALNATYAFSKHVKLTLGVDNLFNRTYSEHLNLAGNAGFGYGASVPVNEPGRTGWARLTMQF